MTPPRLTVEQREGILQFDTCKIANAIEKLGIRLRNEGFTRPGLRCVTRGFPAVLGYAATSKVKCADPPTKGYSYYDLADWWEIIARRPEPRIAVIEDVDREPGQGAVLSDVHAHVLQALHCQAVVTNGAVRNVPALAGLGFAAFACHVTMSHAYVHMVDHGVPVEILGLSIAPADLIYADVHGVLLVPGEAVDDLIRLAREQAAREARVIDLCRSAHFELGALRSAIQTL